MSTISVALTRAVSLHQAGRLDEASDLYRDILARDADQVDARHLLGVLAHQQGRHEEAAENIRRAVVLDPRAADFRVNLASVLLATGDLDGAAREARAALALDGSAAAAHSTLSAIAFRRGLPEEAEAHARHAVRLAPGFAPARYNLGCALHRLERNWEAVPCFRAALELDPGHLEARVNLGRALEELGRTEAAETCYREVLSRRPDFAAAHWNLALAQLRRGDFCNGWKGYEWRWTRPGVSPRSFIQPLWDGSPLEGRRILLHAEQGLGDTIQFVRYVAAVERLGGDVILECQAPLCGILASAPGAGRVIPQGAALPPFDVHVPLLSLPRLVSHAWEVPYLRADRALAARWRETVNRLAAGRPKIGLVWAGNPGQENDYRRSLTLSHLAPLARLGNNFAFFRLQRGPAARQPGMDLIPLDNETVDDTAAILMNLDLLVSTDTMPPHLAGALGCPVWMLVSFLPDWRWMLGREDCPWYPGMRLFRQPEPAAWKPVIERLAAELEESFHGRAR
jgi:tetratricopeptide (TPR) repeat protein